MLLAVNNVSKCYLFHEFADPSIVRYLLNEFKKKKTFEQEEYSTNYSLMSILNILRSFLNGLG